MRHNEHGRSMLEIVAVVAIMVLLVFGGLQMWRMAQEKSTAQTVAQRVVELKVERKLNIRTAQNRGKSNRREDQKAPRGMNLVVENGVSGENENYFWVTASKMGNSLCSRLVHSDLIQADKVENNCETADPDVTFYFYKHIEAGHGGGSGGGGLDPEPDPDPDPDPDIAKCSAYPGTSTAYTGGVAGQANDGTDCKCLRGKTWNNGRCVSGSNCSAGRKDDECSSQCPCQTGIGLKCSSGVCRCSTVSEGHDCSICECGSNLTCDSSTKKCVATTTSVSCSAYPGTSTTYNGGVAGQSSDGVTDCKCPTGQIWKADTKKCAKAINGGGECKPELCQIEVGETCVLSSPNYSNGTSCLYDCQCQSGSCSGGVCGGSTPLTCTPPCQANQCQECRNGSCQNTSDKGSKSIGATCSYDCQCQSDKCNGVCVSCTKDSDCNNGFKCDVGKCKEPCTQNSDCDTGYCNQEKQVCDNCTSSSNCDPCYACSNGKCQVNNNILHKIANGGTCSDSCECQTGLSCGTGKKCVECEADTDCNGNLKCDEGKCKEPCTQNSDCDTGYCNQEKKVCENCTSSSNCDPCYACSNGKCQVNNNILHKIANGGTCSDSCECQTGLSCGAEKKCIECEADTDCDGNLKCDEGKCKEPCTQNSDCDTGYCNQEKKLCEACTSDSNCDPCYFCSNGKCLVNNNVLHKNVFGITCLNSCECQTGLSCGSEKRCVECEADTDCDGNLKCDEGKCKEPCTQNSDCDTGYCNQEKKLCDNCTSDSNCDPCYACSNGKCQVNNNILHKIANGGTCSDSCECQTGLSCDSSNRCKTNEDICCSTKNCASQNARCVFNSGNNTCSCQSCPTPGENGTCYTSCPTPCTGDLQCYDPDGDGTGTCKKAKDACCLKQGCGSKGCVSSNSYQTCTCKPCYSGVAEGGICYTNCPTPCSSGLTCFDSDGDGEGTCVKRCPYGTGCNACYTCDSVEKICKIDYNVLHRTSKGNSCTNVCQCIEGLECNNNKCSCPSDKPLWGYGGTCTECPTRGNSTVYIQGSDTHACDVCGDYVTYQTGSPNYCKYSKAFDPSDGCTGSEQVKCSRRQYATCSGGKWSIPDGYRLCSTDDGSLTCQTSDQCCGEAPSACHTCDVEKNVWVEASACDCAMKTAGYDKCSGSRTSGCYTVEDNTVTYLGGIDVSKELNMPTCNLNTTGLSVYQNGSLSVKNLTVKKSSYFSAGIYGELNAQNIEFIAEDGSIDISVGQNGSDIGRLNASGNVTIDAKKSSASLTMNGESHLTASNLTINTSADDYGYFKVLGGAQATINNDLNLTNTFVNANANANAKLVVNGEFNINSSYHGDEFVTCSSTASIEAGKMTLKFNYDEANGYAYTPKEFEGSCSLKVNGDFWANGNLEFEGNIDIGGKLTRAQSPVEGGTTSGYVYIGFAATSKSYVRNGIDITYARVLLYSDLDVYGSDFKIDNPATSSTDGMTVTYQNGKRSGNATRLYVARNIDINAGYGGLIADEGTTVEAGGNITVISGKGNQAIRGVGGAMNYSSELPGRCCQYGGRCCDADEPTCDWVGGGARYYRATIKAGGKIYAYSKEPYAGNGVGIDAICTDFYSGQGVGQGVVAKSDNGNAFAIKHVRFLRGGYSSAGSGPDYVGVRSHCSTPVPDLCKKKNSQSTTCNNDSCS